MHLIMTVLSPVSQIIATAVILKYFVPCDEKILRHRLIQYDNNAVIQ
jgi:hypothetical protein